MTKYEIYNIVNGVFLTFSKNLSKKLLCISHSREVIDKKISLFPSSTSLSKPDFIILTVFLMYKYNPSSVFSLCQKFTAYRIVISLYDGDNYIGDVYQYLIIR